MGSNSSETEGDDYFTAASQATLVKSTDIAVKFSSDEVKPLHMMLALLYQNQQDYDNSSQLENPDQPTLLLSVIKDVEGDPLAFAEGIKHSINNHSPPPAPPSAPINRNQGSLAPPKQETPKPRRPFYHFKKSSSPLASDHAPRAPRSARPSPVPSVHNADRPPSPSNALVVVIASARRHMEEMGDSFVAPFHLLFALTEDPEVQDLFKDLFVPVPSFRKALRDRKPQTRIAIQEDNQFPFLAKYTSDLSALALEGKLNEIVGRDEEIRRVIRILCRRTKNSAVLLGEPGVGKTAVAEGLAHRIAHSQVPQSLKGTIYSLDIGALFAGAGKGEYEARVKGVIDDVMRRQESGLPVILFIDELHLITVGKSASGQSSGMDAANLLKPALARGQFRCIGATTLAEYREHIEKDGALERRFATVMVNEPAPEEAITILRGIRGRYEHHHQVWITDSAIVTAVTLAHRYLTARRLPDSAVDLMDEACASARVSQDMKPEAIDTLEKEISTTKVYIESLERDDHPDADSALANARNSLVDKGNQIKYLERQQENVKEWWLKLTEYRNTIQKKRAELQNSAGTKPRKITALQAELTKWRADLAQLEHQGPKPVDGSDLSDKTRYSLSSPNTITPESIAEIVEKATGVPVQRLLATERGRLLNLEQMLSQRVIGQPEAVKAVASAIQVSRTGLGNTNRPISSLLFTGPSGTGKTLLSKALAHELFGRETSMIRIDGSEYSQSHSVSRLVGSPPGYVGYDQGGQLTEYVRRTPYCIVLLDEIEKTCAEFLTLLLQVLDEGRLTDGQGRLVDFRNCVIIMTSNVGSDILSLQSGELSERTRSEVMDRFRAKGFSPEFLNRIEEVVMFRTMSRAVMTQILEKHLQDLQEREGIKKLNLDLDDAAKEWLIGIGISREYGARPLARAIQRELLNPLSQCLLEETIIEGDTVLVRVGRDKNKLTVKRNGPRPVADTRR